MPSILPPCETRPVVESIWRYPLKSAQGETVTRAFFGLDGPAGDRSWACISADGTVVSAKHPRKWGRMLYVSARLETIARGERVDERLIVGRRRSPRSPGPCPAAGSSTSAPSTS
jgi:hypothetical protein